MTAATPEKIALVGFMGAGKTTVGGLLAQALGLPFYDLDALIAERAQRSVADIFTHSGPTTFRTYERAALRDLLERDEACVIATGGGTVADPSALQRLKRAARCVHLRVPLDVAMQRLSQSGGLHARPLLWGPDAMATATRLYQERQFFYIQAHHSVDAHSGDAAEVAQKVAQVLGAPSSQAIFHVPPAPMDLSANDIPSLADAAPAASLPRLRAVSDAARTLHVISAARRYAVGIAPQAATLLQDQLPASCRGDDVLLLTDEKVGELHGQQVAEALRAAGKHVEVLAVPAHENSKSLTQAAACYAALANHGFGRDATVVALGGGVVGDLAGFVAATYMRGIGLISLPTSTLAAVDSSVGGKNALNTQDAKNMLGTFYPPDAVFIGIDFLKTQAPRHHAAGLVEVVKMAATHDKQLFAQVQRDSGALLRFAEPQLSAALLQALQIKANVVQQDEHDRGDRAVLNFGHTIGHAIELGEAYRLLHGEAVALGMLAETAWGVQQQVVPQATYEALSHALRAFQVPIDWRRARVSLQALRHDKKRQATSVRLPLVVQLGSHAWHTTNLNSLAKFVA